MMSGQLITLPLRISVRATRLWLRTTTVVAGRAVATVRSVVDIATPGGGSPSPARAPVAEPNAPPTAAPVEPETTAAEPMIAPAETPAPEPTTVIREPPHVSEEPELVDEVAEPGAEDGAGAQVRIAEPWKGYARMNAREVIARLADTSAAQLAAVRLYETGNRGRQTVLAAVDRQLKTTSSSSSN